MEDLLRYFIQETNEKLSSMDDKMGEMGGKLSDLQSFKAEMLATARTTALFVSGICGFITLTATVLLVYYTRIGAHP